LSEMDVVFIKEIIKGTPEHERQGRCKEKHWLYDVVNNTRSGLDVDKLDYFQRDMRYSNVPMNNDFNRFIDLGLVLPAEPVDGRSKPSKNLGDSDKLPKMICYPAKMYEEALSLFQVRFKMHRHVYTHMSVKQVEFMITDALTWANPHIRIQGTKNETFPTGEYKLSETVLDMAALANVKDSILDIIMSNPSPELAEAQHIIKRIRKRQLYKCIGKLPYRRSSEMMKLPESTILQEILACASSTTTTSATVGGLLEGEKEQGQNETDWSGYGSAHGLEEMSPHELSAQSAASQQSCASDAPLPFFYDHPGSLAKSLSMSQTLLNGSHSQSSPMVLTEKDLIVEKMHIHHGMKAKNPVSRLRFFSKSQGNEPIGVMIDESFHETALPKAFEDFAVRVFCRFEDKEEIAKHAFKVWVETNSHI
jgi:hypothetical protein